MQSGSTVEWVNQDDTINTANSAEMGYGHFEHAQDGIFDSGSLEGGKQKTLRYITFHFEEPGRYDYFCIPHPWMNGIVVVD